MLGEHSNFVSQADIENYKDVFENININKDIKIIPKAGHWVQADQPIVFINEVSAFLKEIFWKLSILALRKLICLFFLLGAKKCLILMPYVFNKTLTNWFIFSLQIIALI